MPPHGANGMAGSDAPPESCPYCGAHDVRTAEYDAPLRILRPRRWHYCTSCDWEAEAGRPTGIPARAGRGG